MYFFVQKRKRKESVKRSSAGWMRACAMLLICVLCSRTVSAAQTPDEEISLYATAAVLMDADTGRVLYEKNGDAFMANASTTKIMTCIVALENAALTDNVEVSSHAAGMPKVKLYMRQGEHYKLEDLLYSLMLESHNDTAVAIAEHVGGSMEGFAALMNEKARQIGCENTWFITPNGLDATQTLTDKEGNVTTLFHGTCARDLAKIMAYCTYFSPFSEEFIKITGTSSYSFINEEGRSFSCVNHNAFLHMMDGAVSGKTGFTNKAGYCYVGALNRDGRRFTIALLACGWPNHKTYKWTDSRALFSYGIDNYTYREFSPFVKTEPIPVAEGASDDGNPYRDVSVSTGKSGDILPLTLLVAEGEEVQAHLSCKKELTAPVRVGETVGTVTYYLIEKNGGSILLASEEILTECDVPKKDYTYVFSYVLRLFLL